MSKPSLFTPRPRALDLEHSHRLVDIYIIDILNKRDIDLTKLQYVKGFDIEINSKNIYDVLSKLIYYRLYRHKYYIQETTIASMLKDIFNENKHAADSPVSDVLRMCFGRAICNYIHAHLTQLVDGVNDTASDATGDVNDTTGDDASDTVNDTGTGDDTNDTATSDTTSDTTGDTTSDTTENAPKIPERSAETIIKYANKLIAQYTMVFNQPPTITLLKQYNDLYRLEKLDIELYTGIAANGWNDDAEKLFDQSYKIFCEVYDGSKDPARIAAIKEQISKLTPEECTTTIASLNPDKYMKMLDLVKTLELRSLHRRPKALPAPSPPLA